jgi:hypothetical protein
MPLPEDTRVIHRYAEYTVLAQRYEVMWPDGSAVKLHPVLRDEARQPYLRAWSPEGLHWIITDLSLLDPHLAEDTRHMRECDIVKLVFAALRHRYPTAAAFQQQAWMQAVHSWWPDATRSTTLPCTPVRMGA